MSFKFYNHLDGEERAGCFTLTVFTASILWLFLMVAWVGLRCVIVVFSAFFTERKIQFHFEIIIFDPSIYIEWTIPNLLH